MATHAPKPKLGREDYKKKKELDEMRKLGAAPAEVDDDGFMINPHIPQYMAEAPWYLSDNRPGLRHQRLVTDPTTFTPLHDIIPRGVVKSRSKKPKKWKKGCCENCGSSTHVTKDCVERPRKHKAKFSNTDMAPDEHVPEERKYTWDGKRDRWNNYDIALHQQIIDRHEKIREYRRKKKMEELNREILEGDEEAKRKLKKLRKKKAKAKKVRTKDGDDDDSSSDSDSDSDDSDIDSDDDMRDKGEVIQKFDSKKRQTVRNLRIREDLPKYLRNYDLSSAYYDPKTRSMRENPYEGLEDAQDEMYQGDNFVRSSGDAVKFGTSENFAWEARQVNTEAISEALHMQANPTLTEMAHRKFKDNKSGVQTEFRQKIMAKYGGEEHFANPDKELLLGQSEAYNEYAADGRVIKGPELYIPKSKYIEDTHPGNHRSVWGSYFDVKTREWGYGCCHSTVYKAYCTGNSGIAATSKDGTNARSQELRRAHLRANKPVATVAPKPKEFESGEKLVNPSGYVSTKGIMAAKALARKQQLALEKKKARKAKKRNRADAKATDNSVATAPAAATAAVVTADGGGSGADVVPINFEDAAAVATANANAAAEDDIVPPDAKKQKTDV